jgi:hypothetical protein
MKIILAIVLLVNLMNYSIQFSSQFNSRLRLNRERELLQEFQSFNKKLEDEKEGKRFFI